MSSKKPPARVRPSFVLNAALVARLHTSLAYTAFTCALILGCLFHYKKIVKNGVAGYPEEWFPSVSATIGDWYPERNIFQILIALTSGPRFALVLFQYYLHYPTRPTLATVILVFGLIRTLSCGGWVYITSSDDHDAHDVFMILYMLCNIPWMIGGIACTPKETVGLRRNRILTATAFFVCIIPLIYFFIQHKVHEIPGAYTRYSFFEWGLIFFDVLYDAITEQEFREAELQIVLGPTSSLQNGVAKPTEPRSSPTTESDSNAEKSPSQVTDSKIPTRSILSIRQFRPALSFISDVYLSYIFWSTFTALLPTLFYFSVWELGIAGHEFTLLATLSPALLSVRPLFRWAKTKGGQAVAHVLGMTAIGAVFLPGPGARLAVVGPAVGMGVLRAAAEWSEEEHAVHRSLVAGLGWTVAALSKHLNHSNNPVWPFGDKSSIRGTMIGLVLGLVAVYEQYRRPSAPTPKNSSSNQNGKPASALMHWLTTALPLGSLIFTLHNLVSDPSTLIAWSWTGYENGTPKGPVPHLHGSLTLVAQCVGLLLPIVLSSTPSTLTESQSRSHLHLLSHRNWFAFGGISAYIMYTYKNWTGYAGGLGFAVFLMSIVPGIFGRAVISGKQSPAGIWAGAMLVYCLLVVVSILTVAYAFVPGGQLFRERTGSVLIAQMLCLALAFGPRVSSPLENRNTFIPRSAASFSKALLAIVSVLSVLGTLYRWPSAPPQPYKPGPRVFNAGVWTLHFGIDNTGRDSQRGVLDLIRDMELDVVGFLETDLHRTTFGHRDLTRLAVQELGYYVDIGPGPNAHTWGAALLSKFPIINSTHHLLPSPHGELAPAIEAVLDVYGTEITVVVSHNGQEEDPLDRELQSKELAQIMAASYPRPVVFLGYVVTKPHDERPSPYKYLVEDGRMHDIDDEDPDRWCEYILYRGVYRTAYARVSRGIITDTELQIGQFTLPKYGVGVTNETRGARYLRSFKEELPEYHWFPLAYYGNENQGGVNRHFYHVFGTPLYYKLPEGAVL